MTKPTEHSGTPPKVAVVGMGYWGKNLVRNFHDLGSLAVVCDEDAEREATVREKCPGAAFTTDYGAVLGDASVPAVVLATPAVTHYTFVSRALEAGKDVFVEKPLALTIKEGQALVQLADKSHRILMVGHILRYHAAVVKLNELIRAGELGRIQYLCSNRLNMGKIRTAENILWSFAPHDISVMLALLEEEPCEVTCEGGAYLNQNIPDVTMSLFRFPSGVRAHIYVSWLHPFKEQRLVVVGSEKMAVFDDTADDKLVLYPHKVEWHNRMPTAVKAEPEKVPLETAEPLRSECAHFLDCVQRRVQPVTDGKEGLRVLHVLSACQTSLESGRRISPATEAGGRDTEPGLEYFVHETARVDDGCRIGRKTKIWHYSHVMKGAQIGERCILGQNVNIDGGAVIGNNVKIQNNVSAYGGVTVEDDVFLGPSCVLTNVSNPRSQINRHALYERTLIRRGATVGANATIVCGITIGRYAFIAAGSVVTRDVPDYGLVMGNPGHWKGWMTRHGHHLGEPDEEGIMTCPESSYRYRETEPGVLRCLDLDEEAPLPPEQCVGDKPYRDFK